MMNDKAEDRAEENGKKMVDKNKMAEQSNSETVKKDREATKRKSNNLPNKV